MGFRYTVAARRAYQHEEYNEAAAGFVIRLTCFLFRKVTTAGASYNFHMAFSDLLPGLKRALFPRAF